MVRRIIAEVERIERGVGFGRVIITIEKGQPRWIEASTREWLAEREGAPPERVGPKMA